MTEEDNKNISELDSIACLIVDDDKFSRTFIKTALYHIGIKNIKEAETAEEATSALKNGEIHIILLDQQMPDKTGIDFAKDIRAIKEKQLSDIPIIMITIDTKEKTVLDAKELGIQDYIVKPISPLVLKKRICKALEINPKGK